MAEIDSGIKHLIALKERDILVEACQTPYEPTDSTYVDAVGIRSVELTGRERLVLIIRHMDPIKEEGASDTVRSGISDVTAVFREWPAGLIGGQYFEMMRGVIELRADFSRTSETSEEADRIVQRVLARAKKALIDRITEFGALRDEMGEQCVMFRMVGGTEYDSGEGTSNISRYFLRWAALTLTAKPRRTAA